MQSLEFPAAKRRKHGLIYCVHCEKNLPASTYYRHREEFYNPANQHWQKLTSERSQETFSSESNDEENDSELPGCDFQGW